MDLVIDNEFAALIPPLDEKERAQLEENILRDGIQDPLKVWQGILIDGHNRYEIAKAHRLNFTTTEMAFDSRDDVKIWIIRNQLGRRNLNKYVRSELVLQFKSIIAERSKERMLAGVKVEDPTQNSDEGTPDYNDCVQPPTTDFKSLQREKRKAENERSSIGQLAAIANVSRDTIAKVEKIQQQASPEIKAALRTGDLSINAAYNKVQQAARKEDIQRQAEEIEQQAVEKPDGLFDVIVIDPPWGYVRETHHGSFDANGRRCTNPYPEMTQSELKAIDLPAAENCVLFLWTTHKFIWDAKELLDKWRFDYRCTLVWNKQQMGMGNLFRMQCEFCLVALKGKPTFNDVHNLRDIIEEPRREHSRKPEEFYRMVDTLCIGRKLDYFSRTQREGWETYGNDTEKF